MHLSENTEIDSDSSGKQKIIFEADFWYKCRCLIMHDNTGTVLMQVHKYPKLIYDYIQIDFRFPGKCVCIAIGKFILLLLSVITFLKICFIR